MRSRFGWACLCVTSLVALAGGASTASAACPNEALREAQRATFLPECRAFEQVSPVDKNSANVFQAENSEYPTGISVAPSGNAATFQLTGPLADAQSAPLWNLATATRAEGWASRSINSPQKAFTSAGFLSTTLAVSSDQSRIATFSALALAPGATDGHGNYYIYTPATGTYQFVASFPNPSDTERGDGTLWVGNDGKHLIFTEDHALTPDATAGVGNIYEYDEGQLRLLTTPGWGVSSGLQETRQRFVSEDGSRVFFTQEDAVSRETGLFMTEEGGPAVAISVSHIPGDPPTVVTATFEGASADGSVAYFRTEVKLTPDAEPNGSAVLYRYEVESDTLTAVTPSSLEPGGIPAIGSLMPGVGLTPVSRDGSSVYFQARGKLTTDAVEGEEAIYGWHAGETRRIGAIPIPLSVREMALSPDGTKLAFAARARLTAFDNADPAVCGGFLGQSECVEVYLYDWTTDDLTCVSCPDRAGEPVGNSLLGGPRHLGGGGGFVTDLNAVNDSGIVFFDTPEQLVAADTNGKRDVYVFRDGEAQLITTGIYPGDSFFQNATPSGSDVFFTTGQRLVGQDNDDQTDVYTARVNGGLASQEPPPTPAPCSGSACLEQAASPPGPAAIVSNRIQGAGNAVRPGKKAKKRCAVRRKAKGKRRSQGKHRSRIESKQLRRGAACKGGNR